MILKVTADGWFEAAGARLPCALGRGGRRADKREGDGATPTGRFPLRRMLYRADRMARPATRLPVRAIAPDDGWCDDPADGANYNRPVRLPHRSSAERLWRPDHLYDLIVVLGHNDDPPVPFVGSAIFLHLARDAYAPTEGCVALEQAHLLWLLARAAEGDLLVVEPPA
ncbi:MAG: L,D-transpeptidase family protein [Alphaproteobacteria bacterium]|nr:L,D-transpeptidase family protein [Alphaproteobacteria bacterium]